MKERRVVDYKHVKWVAQAVIALRLRNDGFSTRQVNRILRALNAPSTVRIEYEIDIHEDGKLVSIPRAVAVTVGALRVLRK